MIRALIFDCFGVLYRDNLSLLFEIVPADKRTQLRDIVHASDHGLISRQEYYEYIASLSGKTIDDIQVLSAQQYNRNESLVELATSLKSRYKIGLLSNIGNETMDSLFPADERKTIFDAFILSSDVGLIKPSREIYNVTAEQLDEQPEDCLMIDDIPANVEGAKQAGMQALLFTTNQQFQHDFAALEANNA